LESYAHPLYKQKILEASSGDTEYTNLYGRARWPGAHHRTLRTPFFETWKNKLAANGNELNQPIIGQTKVFEREEDVPRFSGKVPNLTTTGEVENMAMYAGTGVGQINEILPAAIVLRSIVEEAEAIIEHRLRGLVESQDSKVSHLHTMV
jgi:NAD(P)H-dependent flavin oxidoreductase YrpB (nitropropane dioxygenase family)